MTPIKCSIHTHPISLKIWYTPNEISDFHTAQQCSKFYTNRQSTNNIPTCQICFKIDHSATQCYQLQANSGFGGQENWRVLGDDRHGRPGKR